MLTVWGQQIPANSQPAPEFFTGKDGGSLNEDLPAAFVQLDPITIRPFSVDLMDAETAKQYRKTRYHVIKVYPYARQALERMAQLDSVASHAEKHRETRKFRHKLENELKDEFKDDLKNLTKTQGKILISMLERQTGRPFYDLLRDLKSGLVATFWQSLGKTYGYDLKGGYDPAEDPMLEMILSDLEWPDYKPEGRIMR